uniref:Uncharacterized protein n=1 Tax=Arundo donax TaxID=35708 RepID=A0A0A9EN43_ARUDO
MQVCLMSNFVSCQVVLELLTVKILDSSFLLFNGMIDFQRIS